ncbi:MAG: TolC family protein [Bacteroidota bacterium]
MNKIKFGIVLVLLSVWHQSNAQLKISLLEAVQMAKDKSLQASINLNTFYAAQFNYKSAFTNLLPSINANINAPGLDRSIGIVPQPDGTIKFIERTQAQSNANLTLQQNILATGGTVYVSSALNRFDLLSSGGYTNWQASPLLVGVTQPLLRFNELKFQWQLAKLRYKQTSRQYAERTEELSLQITQTYFDAVNAEAEYNLASFNLAVNDTLLRLARGRYNLGKIGEDDLLQTELRLMNAQNSFDQATLNYSNNMNQLKIILGLSKETQIELRPETNLPFFEPDITKAVANAVRSRSDFLQINIEQKQIEASLKRAQLNKLPNAELNATYGLSNTADNIEGSYKNPLDQQRVSIGLNVPLMNWGRYRNDYKAAKHQFKAKDAELQLAYLNLEQEVVFQVMQYKQLKQRVIISAKADTIAQKRYEVAKNRYFIGKIDNTNLNIAQTEKDLARNNYYQTLKEYWMSYYRLRRTTLYDFEKQTSLFTEQK